MLRTQFITVLVLSILISPLSAQEYNFSKPIMAGQLIASQYGLWQLQPAGTIANPGTATLTLVTGTITLPDAGAIMPLAVGTPVLIEDGAASEVVVPISVSCALNATPCEFKAVFSHAHIDSFRVASATGGLQEAINQLSQGGTVRLTPEWNGTDQTLTLVHLPSSVLLHDERPGHEGWMAGQGGQPQQVLALEAGNVVSTRWNNIRLASEFQGADCGARIQAADSDLGTNPGEIWVNQACGLNISSPIVLGAQHVLRFIEPGTWTLTAASPQITLSSNSALVGEGPGTMLKMGDDVNAQMMVHIPSTAANAEVLHLTLDGNRSMNSGPYPGGEALIWIGDSSSTGQIVNTRVAACLFQSPELSAIFVNDVEGVVVEDNRGTDIGGQFFHAGGSVTGPSYTQNLIVQGNRSDFSERVLLPMVNTQGTQVTWLSGPQFNSRWGQSGYDNVMNIAGNNYQVSGCSSPTTCTLLTSAGDQSGVAAAVGMDFGVGLINVNSTLISGNRLSGPNGGYEGINITIGSDNTIEGNLVQFPSPHVIGAEGITISTDVSGGITDDNTVIGNTVLNPFSTGITVISLNPSNGGLHDNSIIGNTVTNANGGLFLPAPGYDSAIRIAGSNVVATLIQGNICRQTRTGLLPARNRLNYCVSVDGAGKTRILGNTFTPEDTTGYWAIWRDNGTDTTISGPDGPQDSIDIQPGLHLAAPIGNVVLSLSPLGGAQLLTVTPASTSEITISDATQSNYDWLRLDTNANEQPGRVEIANGAATVDPNGTLGFGQLHFKDGTMLSHAPRMLFSAVAIGEVTSVRSLANWILSQGIILTRLQAQAAVTPVGCTTNAVLSLSGGGSTLTLPLNGGSADSGPLTQSIAAGATLTLGVQTPATGCSTMPANVTITAEYEMQ